MWESEIVMGSAAVPKPIAAPPSQAEGRAADAFILTTTTTHTTYSRGRVPPPRTRDLICDQTGAVEIEIPDA